MKNDVSRRYYARIVMNIIYSAIITCLVEIFLVANISMLVRYLREQGHQGRLLEAISGSQPLVVLLYVLFGILLFSGTLLFLQGPSIRYMNQISDAIQDLSEGNLNTTVKVVGDDEFSGMAANLNKMAEDIRRLMEKERESERTKNELITNVAHDLRTPLTSIIGYLELLERNPSLEPELQSKYIEIAYGKSKRLEKLIQDLFGFTKLNYGKIAMHVTQLDIVKLLSQLLEESYPSFAQKGLSYDLQSNVPAKTITADGTLLARLFDNLIGNAIKYGADGKRVLVQIRAEEEVVSVSVTNYGFVIPPEELPLIFNKFYRVEQSRSSSTGGTGLGLAIAKEIVEMHGGSIGVSSDLNGTVFTVKLQVHFDINKEHFDAID
ncbi:MAG TPA: HAMP domain-containing histidine kinase [Candidatus Enterocloster faecavium]|uniref:histidine kinase n=1 Tax=Candidatus Enterocloster faecavium TaxID=2838560 RepID=A0A9D2LAJ4_9FIRM|nr:HAMP domain-containing histidine kinase [Candidatus Enterocloster faecavium]